MLACFGETMKSKKERISGSCGACGHERQTQTRLIPLCVLYMFRIQQQTLHSLVSGALVPSIVSR